MTRPTRCQRHRCSSVLSSLLLLPVFYAAGFAPSPRSSLTRHELRKGSRAVAAVLPPVLRARSSEEEQDDNGAATAAAVAIFGAIPLASLGLPALLAAKLYAPLFIAKRALIYSMAFTVVAVGSVRGARDDPSLGGRLVALTQEVLPEFTGLDEDAQDDAGEENENNDEKEEEEEDKTAKSEDTRFSELQVLDGVGSSTLSVALPLLVASSLAFSVFLLKLQETGGSGLFDASGVLGGGLDGLGGFGASLRNAFSALAAALPQFSVLSNVLVVSLFTRSEIARALQALSSAAPGLLPALSSSLAAATTSEPNPGDGGNGGGSGSGEVNNAVVLGDEALLLALSLSGALAVTALAYVGPASLVWPLRNLVGMSIGVAVARAVQLPRLPPLLVALSLLVVYDVVSVGVQLVNLGSASLAVTASASASVSASSSAAASAAVSPTTTAAAAAAAAASSSSSAGSSAMGAVALSKVSAGAAAGGFAKAASWQPGLLEVELRGRVTDLLGLGDAVFPALLSTLCLRFDDAQQQQQQQQQQRRRRRQEAVSSNNNSDDDDDKNNNRGPPYYFATSLLGFSAGCVACDLAPGIDSSGLPALLFIVPSMLTAVLGLAAVRGQLAGPDGLWAFDPAGASSRDEAVDEADTDTPGAWPGGP